MKTYFLIISLVVLFCGCATVQPPTAEQFKHADYGKVPNNYKEIVSQYLATRLIDPYSAVYSNWRGPANAWYSANGSHIFGYAICVDVNAKNRMGGYVGSKTYYLFIRNDVVLHSDGDMRPGTIGEQRVDQMCQGLQGNKIGATNTTDFEMYKRMAGAEKKGWLGVRMNKMDADMARFYELKNVEGLLISEISPASPAEKAGLNIGDVIIEINKEKAEAPAQLKEAIQKMTPGKTVEAIIVRKGQRMNIPLTIGETY